MFEVKKLHDRRVRARQQNNRASWGRKRMSERIGSGDLYPKKKLVANQKKIQSFVNGVSQGQAHHVQIEFASWPSDCAYDDSLNQVGGKNVTKQSPNTSLFGQKELNVAYWNIFLRANREEKNYKK